MKKNICKLLFCILLTSSNYAYSQQFQKVNPATFVNLGYSHANWGDYDNDGFLDICLTGSDQFNHDTCIIYHNNGDSSFTDMLINLPALDYSCTAWGDYDKDGDLDLLLSGRHHITGKLTRLYRNDGSNVFTLTSNVFTAVSASSVGFVDYDSDGDLDIFISGTTLTSSKVCQVYQNNGGNYSLDNTPNFPGVSQGSVQWSDFNKDGLFDVLVSGSDNSNNRITQLYKNNGNRSFTSIAIPGLSGITSGSAAWGDYNNDGLEDILLSGLDNLNTNICKVFKNNGGNSFTAISAAGLTGISASYVSWGDYNNDGLLDILASGYDASIPDTKVYKNNGNDTFTALSFVAAGLPNTFSGTTIWGDFDNDKDLDVFVTGFGTLGVLTTLYRNRYNIPNVVPTVPVGLKHSTNNDKAHLSWSPSTDNSTPSKVLTYNLLVGTSKTNLSAVAPEANTGNGWKKIVSSGNGHEDTTFFLQNLPQGKYYWSVQSVDHNYDASNFSALDSFSICRKFSLGNDTVICYKDSLSLHAGAAGETVNWYKEKAPGVIAMNQLAIKIQVTVSDTIWATIINNVAGCTTFDTIVVKVNPPSILKTGNDTSICLNKTIVLGGNPTASGGMLAYTFKWSPGNTLSDSTRSNPIASPLHNAHYRLITQSGNCKPDTAFVNVGINLLPKVTTIKDTSIGAGESLPLKAFGANTYSWSPSQGLSNSTVMNPIATPIESVIYIVTGKDLHGCTDTAEVFVTVSNLLFIPTLFSPDDNGSNDLFLVYGAGIEKIDFKIWNRYGELVFHSTDPNQLQHTGWDGRYAGVMQSSQSFVWTMEGRYFDGTELKYQGKNTGTLILKR